MEHLVTMTTNVPPGTSDAAVDDVRSREAARSRELAQQGTLLRLWRPPLEPGQWRTIGLFATADAASLEQALGSMPLRVWRTDDVVPLGRHPNDPGAAPGSSVGREFLTTFTVTIPTDRRRVDIRALLAREAARARELADEMHLERLWTMPAPADQPKVLGLWRAADQAQLDDILQSLPMCPWLAVQTTSLTPHPNDPAGAAV